jgi:hypothetical protein
MAWPSRTQLLGLLLVVGALLLYMLTRVAG